MWSCSDSSPLLQHRSSKSETFVRVGNLSSSELKSLAYDTSSQLIKTAEIDVPGEDLDDYPAPAIGAKNGFLTKAHHRACSESSFLTDTTQSLTPISVPLQGPESSVANERQIFKGDEFRKPCCESYLLRRRMDMKDDAEVVQHVKEFNIGPTGVYKQRSRNLFPEDGHEGDDDNDDGLGKSLEPRSRSHPKPRLHRSLRLSSGLESDGRTFSTPNRQSYLGQSNEYVALSLTNGARQRQSFIQKSERRQRRSSSFNREDSSSYQFRTRDTSSVTYSSSGSRSSAEESPEQPYRVAAPSKAKKRLHGTELPPHPSKSFKRGYRSRHASTVSNKNLLSGSPLDTIRSLSPPPRRFSLIANFCRSSVGKKGGRARVRFMALVGVGLTATLIVALVFVTSIKLHYNSASHVTNVARLFLPPKEAVRSVVQKKHDGVILAHTPGSLRTKEKASKSNYAVLSAATSEIESIFEFPPMERYRKRVYSKKRICTVDPNIYGHGNAGVVSKHPRVLSVSRDHNNFSQPISRKVKLYSAEFSDNTQLYGVLDSGDEALSLMEIREPYSSNECVPMQDWQTTYHPSCNVMHETNLIRLNDADTNGDMQLFGTKGYWRNAWRIDLLGDHHSLDRKDTIVLKTLKFHHNFEDAHFEHDRIDAIAMERLTSSPHVINIFGFCGHSVFTEYADGPRLGTLADKSKKRPLKRLEIARDIATGLADVHGIDGDGNATFVHLDINPANVVVIGKSLKLNDFNIGIPLKWNTTSNTQCGFPAQYPNPQWRSPEEANNSQHLTEKVDIFSMGHIFFRMICGHEPWNKLEIEGRPSPEEVTKRVRLGELPHIPNEILSSDDREVQVIRDAMLQCYTVDPEKRPSARSIASFLDEELQYLTGTLQPEAHSMF